MIRKKRVGSGSVVSGIPFAARASQPAPARDPKLNEAARTLIGENLRSMYDEVAQGPIPDRFLKLLEQLDANSQKK